ncbi:RNA polymerase sigma factor [Streptomyces longisporoflavus]|uniref:RNA polymerase sigma factor n=1 Tax=Streptomyces longisporoflavus TaxID=28044 RepID=A0ABW7QKS6_9ACTN
MGHAAESQKQAAKWAEVGNSYEQDKPYIIRFLLRQGATFEEAQDASHTAFLEFYRSSAPVARPRAWLRTVALRAFYRQAVKPCERLEQAVEEQRGASLVDWHTPLEAVELSEQQRQVFSALVQLPFKQRSVMAWHLDGFSTAEIAHEMNMAHPAVLQNLSRARRTLKEQLGITNREGAR